VSSFLPLEDIGAFGRRWMWRGIILAFIPEKGLDLVAKIACSMVPSLLVPAGNETGLKVRL